MLRPLGRKQSGTVRTMTTSVSFVVNKVASNETLTKASRATRGQAFMIISTASVSSSSSSYAQAVPLSIPGAKPLRRPLQLPPLRLELEGTRPPQKR